MAVLCDRCWGRHANAVARYDGAVDTRAPDLDQDDVSPWETPSCAECAREVMLAVTSYDRHIALDPRPVAAREVPAHARWRLVTTRHPDVSSGRVAVRLRGYEVGPGDLVYAAHHTRCPALEEDRGRA